MIIISQTLTAQVRNRRSPNRILEIMGKDSQTANLFPNEIIIQRRAASNKTARRLNIPDGFLD